MSSAKRRGIAREPPDILLATPESIEVLLSFAADERRALIAGVKTVVIDEAHVFFGNDRGTHLLAIIERLAKYADRDLQRIALPATVGNPKDLARWLHGTRLKTMRICTIPKDPHESSVSMCGIHRRLTICVAGGVKRAYSAKLFGCRKRRGVDGEDEGCAREAPGRRSNLATLVQDRPMLETIATGEQSATTLRYGYRTAANRRRDMVPYDAAGRIS